MLEGIIKFIFPSKCIFCGTLLDINAELDICARCYSRIPFINGKGIKDRRQGYDIKYCDGVFCVCNYSGIVKDSIIKYKFLNKASYYRTFAKLLSYKLKEMTNCRNFDIIVSVPLYKNKERVRGYNQSLLVSKALSKEIGVPHYSGLLVKIKNTESQSLLGKKERYTNIKDAFATSDRDKVKDKSILLVDDILTTGSTISECCKVLKESGAKKVFAAVIATGRQSV
ncbi:MAG: ComF family protein [Clostridia bacterium]|nr:ComF family protein [Clostridia bacterium]